MKIPFVTARKQKLCDDACWEMAACRPKASKAVVFVHGLGSSALSTWAQMRDMCLSDPELADFAFYRFDYPSRKSGLQFWKTLPSLSGLAKGLQTEIAIRLQRYADVLVVAHSMGGLVVRLMIADEIEEDALSKVRRAMLLATPNSGAALAIVASKVLGRNKHTTLLSPYSEALTLLNDKWVNLNIDAKKDVWFVAGGVDQIVSEPSVRGIAGRKLDRMLIGYDHFTITKPESLISSNYLLLKSFLTGETAIDSRMAIAAADVGDPLFERYKVENEAFYVVRDIDAALSNAIRGGSVWLSGSSGVGKTAAITRAILIRGWTCYQIYLGSYTGASPSDLIRSIYRELAERLGATASLPQDCDVPAIILAVKSLLRAAQGNGEAALLIEEIPINCPHSYAEFCGYLHMLMESLESSDLDGQRIFVTSILDPTVLDINNGPKFRAKMQFLPFTRWSETEAQQLSRTLNEELALGRPETEVISIAEASSGVPRFVKGVYRRWRNGTDKGKSVMDIIAQTRTEML